MTDHPEPPKPPPQTLLEKYGTGAEMMYRYGIEIARGSAHLKAQEDMMKAGKKR